MNGFWTGVLGSIIVEIVIFIFAFVVSKIRKSTLRKALSGSRLFGHGVECVYESQSSAIKDILSDVEKSETVKIFCIRGWSYIQTDHALSSVLDKRNKTIQVLVSDPNSPYVSERASEVGKNDSDYKQELTSNISLLQSRTSSHSNIEYRLHKEPPVFRILLLDNRLYMAFFQANKLGSTVPEFRIKASSPLYRGILRYYDCVWRSIPAQTASEIKDVI